MASGFFSRLKQGLNRSSQKISTAITAGFTKRRLDDAALDELEEMLIAADLGVNAAADIIQSFRRSRFGKEVTEHEIKHALAEEIAAILRPVTRSLIVDAATPLPIRLAVDEPRTVGADRIVNTLAASQRYGRDAIVVDLGTATTYDCITADGTFLGGVIAPGVRTSLETSPKLCPRPA